MIGESVNGVHTWTALATNRHLVDVVREQVDAPLDWDNLRDEASYVGSSDAFIDGVLHLAEASSMWTGQ